MSIPPPNAHDPVGHCQWRCACPQHIAWKLHPSSVDVLADIHGRSHSFPFIHPREVFLAWCWVITRPLSSYGVVLLSLPSGVGLTGVGWVHPFHAWQTPTCKEMPASDATRRSWFQCRMCEFSCWSFTSYEGTSVANWHTTSWGLSSHLSLIFLFSWEASACLAPWSSWLEWDCQASIIQHLFSGHSTVSVFEPLL